jgi:outer membrane protein assembly factor BamB
MKKIKTILLGLFIAVTSVLAQDIPKWALDLDEPIQFYEFINNGKYLFITSGEYVWCYSAENGEEIWKMEVPGFEEEGVSQLLGEMYLTNSNDKLQAYDALTGKLIWENEYDGISQADFIDLIFVMNHAMFDYGDDKLGIDLNTGKELYRNEIDFWGELVNLGTFNYDVFETQKKLLIMEESEKAALYDIVTGKQLFIGEDYDVNRDLIKNNLKWAYKDKDETHYVFVLEDAAVLFDMVNNKEAARVQLDIDGDKNVILPTAVGAAVMGEEEMVHFNFRTNEFTQVKFPFDDVRTLSSFKVGGKDILILSLEDRLAAIDLVAGKVLWQTEDKETFEGYVHKYIKVDEDNNLIASYNRARMMSTDYGTYIYLMSINALSGKLNYKTPVLLSQTGLTSFTRGLTKTVTAAFAVLASVGSAGMSSNAAMKAYDHINDLLGYNNIGFNYNVFEYKGDLIFESREKVNMWNPSTRDDPGEGYVRVNTQTGKIVYSSYFEISSGLNEIAFNKLAPIALSDNIKIIPGDEKLIAFDLDKGTVFWTIEGEAGFVTDLMFADGVLYTKFGRQDYSVYLVEDNVEVKELWSEDPYGFMAIDAASGKILWKVNTETDPSLTTPAFSLTNYYNESLKRLYFADEQNVYALKLGKDGGKYDWQYNFDKEGLGEMEYDETFAIQERWIGNEARSASISAYSALGGWALISGGRRGGLDIEASSKFIEDAVDSDLETTYSSYGNIYGVSAKKCLKVSYGKDVLLVTAPEGFALLKAADGSKVWKTEWDYDKKEVNYLPKIIGDKLVYCLDENLVLMNLKDGGILWNAEESDKAKFFTSLDGKYFFSINDETIRAYPVN